MSKKIVKVLFLLGIIITTTGVSLLSIYFIDYHYSREIVQYSEFWAVARTGGGDVSSEDGLYTRRIPLSANVSDLRVFHLSFNISTQEEIDFRIPIQIIATLSEPDFPIFDSEWANSYDSSNINEWEKLWENYGKFTPRNITISLMETVIQFYTNDTKYIISLGRIDDIRYTEKNGSLIGYVYWKDLWLSYEPNKGFIFYMCDDNRTVYYPRFNSNGSWSFSLLTWWDVSFEQLYGPNMYFTGNTTIARWVFYKEDNDNMNVSITIDNTNYHSPIPVYTVIQRPPWIEASILSGGIIGTIIILAYWKKQHQKGESSKRE